MAGILDAKSVLGHFFNPLRLVHRDVIGHFYEFADHVLEQVDGSVPLDGEDIVSAIGIYRCEFPAGKRDGMGWDGMGWDGMGWDGMGWDGMGTALAFGWDGMGWVRTALAFGGIFFPGRARESRDSQNWRGR